MKVISTGVRYEIYSDDLKTYEKLPPKTYSVCFNKMTGFYMEEHADLVITEKVYGVHLKKVEKVLRSFDSFERSLGVILSGYKGIGKSLFAKMLCEAAVKRGIPVLIVDKFIPGIASYIESIEQEILVLFDEFDKTFGNVKTGDNEADPQAGMLSLFDGVAQGKKLFVITCNELRSLNDYLVNRPGRFHYHFRFDYPSASEIREYLVDKLNEDHIGEIDKVVSFANRVNLNYDCLRAIAFELNSGEDFEHAISDLNIINMDAERYRAVLYLENGEKRTAKSEFMDLFSGESIGFWMQNDSQRYDVCVEFVTDACVYDHSRGATIVPGDDLRLEWDCEKEEDDVVMKKIKAERLEIHRIRGKNYHYAAV